MEKNYLIIDTETIGGFGSHIVYDTGLLVMNENGGILETHSFLTKGIFDDIKLMATAFYARHYNKYLEAIASGETKVVWWGTVLETIQHMVEKYEIDTVAAYNENFDNNGMENTTEHFFDNRNWLPENVTHFCIWNAACHAVFDENYIKMARENDWLTEKGNVKTSAEMAYRYITNNYLFEEAHTGLDDCRIEAQILTHILKSGKPFESESKPFPMRRVFELDRFWQIADLEKKETEAEEIAKEIKRLYGNLKNRYKTITKRREWLKYNEDGEGVVEEVLTLTPANAISLAKNEAGY